MNALKSKRRNKKQGGFVMTSELILLSTTMVIGLVVGLATMRDAVTAEMEDVAEAIGSLDQSYAYDGLVNAEGTARIDGSGFVDAPDALAGDGAAFQFVASDFLETGTNINAGTASLGADSAANAGSMPPAP